MITMIYILGFLVMNVLLIRENRLLAYGKITIIEGFLISLYSWFAVLIYIFDKFTGTKLFKKLNNYFLGEKKWYL